MESSFGSIFLAFGFVLPIIINGTYMSTINTFSIERKHVV